MTDVTTIPSGQTSITVAINYGYTPEAIIPEPNDNLGGRSVWVTSLTATSFILHISSSDTVNHDFNYTPVGVTGATVGSYREKYTTLEDIERQLQFVIDSTTAPSDSDVNLWTQEVEQEIDARLIGWGDGRLAGQGYLASDVYLDVVLQPSHILIARTLEALLYRRLLLTAVDVHLGRYFPAITITSLSRRTTGITDSPSWEALTEGWYPGWVESANADYMCERTIGKAAQQHIMKIMVFGGKRPEAGLARVKATFNYGWNVPAEILKRWATLKVANKVLDGLALSGEPTRLASYDKGDFQDYTNNQFDQMIRRNELEMGRLGYKYFPKTPYEAVAIMRI